MKKCSKCNKNKQLVDFSKFSEAKDGLQPYCKACQSSYQKKNRRKYDWGAYTKSWAKNNPEAIRGYYTKRTYGVTTAMYNTMMDNQDGKCAICCLPPVKNRRLCIDHSHITGKVRALLCDRCNLGLGTYEAHKEAYERYLAKFLV